MSIAGDSPSSYWCYRCNRFITISNHPQPRDSSLICPDCNGGFIEEIDGSMLPESVRRRFPAAAMYMAADEQNPNPNPNTPVLRRARRNTGDRSPFNPVIVLRGPEASEVTGNGVGGGFELYYDDGVGSGLRPLPASMSEFLLGSGFDRFLDQLSQVEVNGLGRIDNNPPASKAAIESMPTVEIQDDHVSVESHCAVCKEAFDLGIEAKEMPCKHLYHRDCILPWLALRNSCPVCRHELPLDDQGPVAESDGVQIGNNQASNEEEAVGLTIWRLPGGGFAVGRFSGGRRGGEREFPVVFTEMDGGLNNNGGAPRRISWGSRGNATRENGRFRRVLHGLFSCFGGGGRAAISGGSSRTRRVWGFDAANHGYRRRF